jgi:hypothetical protein
MVDTQNILLATEIILVFELKRDLYRVGYRRRQLAKAQSDIRNIQKQAQRVRDMASQRGLDSVYADITSRRHRLFSTSPLYKRASPFVGDYHVLLKNLSVTTSSPRDSRDDLADQL